MDRRILIGSPRGRRPSVRFVDFWPEFDAARSPFVDALDGEIDLGASEDPDVVFFSSFGRAHQRFPRAIKIFFTGENIRPNRFACDYSIGFDHPAPGDQRHFRLPLFDLYPRKGFDPSVPRDGFCSVVVSNPKSAFRLRFFEMLHARRRVDSGGRVANNVGGPVASKIDFISRYRFNIAFENSSYPGNSTEKLFEAKDAGCIPIYWGNPRVAEDFDPDGFIDLSRFPSWEACIDHVLDVEADPAKLRRYQETPLFRGEADPVVLRRQGLREFLLRVLRQGTRRHPRSAQLERFAATWNRIRTRRADTRELRRWPEASGIATGAGF